MKPLTFAPIAKLKEITNIIVYLDTKITNYEQIKI